jgi:hypothetical protein
MAAAGVGVNGDEATSGAGGLGLGELLPAALPIMDGLGVAAAPGAAAVATVAAVGAGAHSIATCSDGDGGTTTDMFGSNAGGGLLCALLLPPAAPRPLLLPGRGTNGGSGGAGFIVIDALLGVAGPATTVPAPGKVVRGEGCERGEARGVNAGNGGGEACGDEEGPEEGGAGVEGTGA